MTGITFTPAEIAAAAAEADELRHGNPHYAEMIDHWTQEVWKTQADFENAKAGDFGDREIATRKDRYDHALEVQAYYLDKQAAHVAAAKSAE